MSSPYHNMCLSEIRRAEETKDWVGVRHLLLNIWRWDVPDEEMQDLFRRCSVVDMSFTEGEMAVYDSVVSYDIDAISIFLNKMSGKTWWHTLLNIQCHTMSSGSFHIFYLPFKMLFLTDMKEARIALEQKQLHSFIDNLEHLHGLREYFCRIYVKGRENSEAEEVQTLIDKKQYPVSNALCDQDKRFRQDVMLRMMSDIYPQFCAHWRGELGSLTFEQCKKLWEDYDR